MKYIKEFEYAKEKDGSIDPEIGDYVILNAVPGSGLPLSSGENVGIITDKAANGNKPSRLISIDYNGHFKPLNFIHKSWIKYISDNKTELELKLKRDKYNL